jgi:hypothetical protein
MRNLPLTVERLHLIAAEIAEVLREGTSDTEATCFEVMRARLSRWIGAAPAVPAEPPKCGHLSPHHINLPCEKPLGHDGACSNLSKDGKHEWAWTKPPTAPQMDALRDLRVAITAMLTPPLILATDDATDVAAWYDERVRIADAALARVQQDAQEDEMREVWYLAHPVSPDQRFSFDDNMAHVLKVARICHDAGFKVCVPWYADCLYLDDTNAEHRAAGLAMDVALAAQLGRIILVGHRLSGGMSKETDAVRIAGGTVLNLVGVADDDLASALDTVAPHFLQRLDAQEAR